jgi:D-arabinitol dehydrogenase (NADP+)
MLKAVNYTAPRTFRVEELPDPEPQHGEVVLRTAATGICGSDVHIHEGNFFGAYPLIPGHEIVGRVELLGPDVDNLTVGQLVAADNTILCGSCYFCRRGEPLFCQNFGALGVTRPGGFAELVAVRAEKCFPVDLPLETAVLIEPTACAVHGMDVLNLRPGSDVLLFGAGPSGLVLAQLLVHGGAARVTVAAPTAFKLELAKRYGVDETVLIDRSDFDASLSQIRALTPHGFDVVIDATGAPAVLAQTPSFTRDGGTVLVYGMSKPEDRIDISPHEIFKRQLTIKGSFAQTHCFDRALAVLSSGRVMTDGIVTHRFQLERYNDALDAVRGDPSCLKAAIFFD